MNRVATFLPEPSERVLLHGAFTAFCAGERAPRSSGREYFRLQSFLARYFIDGCGQDSLVSFPSLDVDYQAVFALYWEARQGLK